MQSLRIIGLAIGCCVAYGILHDQLTARICVEYFTIGHPPVFPTDDPTLLALGWGIIATWWVGAILGFLLAIAARFGSTPKRSAAELVRPMMGVMFASALFAVVVGGIGYAAARNGWVFLVGELAVRVPTEKHVYFLTDLWAHSASYLAGFVGGLIVVVQTWRARQALRLQSQ